MFAGVSAGLAAGLLLSIHLACIEMPALMIGTILVRVAPLAKLLMMNAAVTWASWLGCCVSYRVLGKKELLIMGDIAWVAIICVVTGIGSDRAASILRNVDSQRRSVNLCSQLIAIQTLFALGILSFMRARP